MTLQITVPKLACSACVNSVTQAIKTIDSSAIIEGNPKKNVRIETQASETAIKEAIAAVG
ncbi:heavy-metal-associated domain-containing protein [Scytonema hofmannii FACHB-248]|uniref:Heavy-metal-associated domain-containing protein n=1 Tax=Scytonema hofmannii FACHB-248 TaxID=1842502 RepID=A0ABR8H0X4_9CYAN|nr:MULTISPECIES: heavy-metal-associated domain-containing protein [Nostocales]MBD2609363.1 heavy-metal-associated domain-containing protein [Scytonema hofmannii FACHB-248]